MEGETRSLVEREKLSLGKSDFRRAPISQIHRVISVYGEVVYELTHIALLRLCLVATGVKFAVYRRHQLAKSVSQGTILCTQSWCGVDGEGLINLL